MKDNFLLVGAINLNLSIYRKIILKYIFLAKDSVKIYSKIYIDNFCCKISAFFQVLWIF